MSLTVAVLTSAGVAALVSSLIALLGQYLERRARRDEMVFSKALEMAVTHTETLIRAAEASGKTAILYDNVIKAETYYRWLKKLLEQGELPQDAKQFSPPKNA